MPCLGRDRTVAGNKKHAWDGAALVVIAAIIAALILTNASAVRAAIITVSTLADPTGASGTCSLRDAITAANTKMATNNCAAGTGSDDIEFSVTGTIALVSTLPAITGNLFITGFGITIDGGGAVQVMRVDSGAALRLNFLTIANGSVTALPAAATATAAPFLTTASWTSSTARFRATRPPVAPAAATARAARFSTRAL